MSSRKQNTQALGRSPRTRPDEFSMHSPRPDEFSNERPVAFCAAQVFSALGIFHFAGEVERLIENLGHESFLGFPLPSTSGCFPPELPLCPGAPSPRRRPSPANSGRRRGDGAPGPLVSSRAEAEAVFFLRLTTSRGRIFDVLPGISG